MTSDQWYAVKRNKVRTVVYLMTEGDRRMVEASAKCMYRDPVITKVTWSMMQTLTGCWIPRDKLPNDFCCGELLLSPLGKDNIIIKVL